MTTSSPFQVKSSKVVPKPVSSSGSKQTKPKTAPTRSSVKSGIGGTHPLAVTKSPLASPPSALRGTNPLASLRSPMAPRTPAYTPAEGNPDYYKPAYVAPTATPAPAAPTMPESSGIRDQASTTGAKPLSSASSSSSGAKPLAKRHKRQY